MQLKPLFDRVVLQPITKDKSQNTGFILPQEDDTICTTAKVIAVGAGMFDHGVKIEMAVSVNDVVVFNNYSASEFKHNNENYLIIKQTDILAVLQTENK